MVVSGKWVKLQFCPFMLSYTGTLDVVYILNTGDKDGKF